MIHDLIDYFGFKTNTDYRNTILSAFENIKSVGLIDDFQVEYFGSQFSKGRINVEKSSKWNLRFSKWDIRFSKSYLIISKWNLISYKSNLILALILE